MKRYLIPLLLAAWLPSLVSASTEDLDALVESVREEALQEARHDQERIERFLDQRDQQRALLAEAKTRLNQVTQRADTLRERYENNERTLTEYELDLTERAGDLNDLFAIVRQTALNANSVLETSLVAAEHEQRSPFLVNLGKSERPPSIEDIKRLWTTVLTEISESGKVVRFDAVVIKPHGAEVEQTVTRAGVFNSVSEGAFLRYLPESGKLVELSRQPAPRFQRMAMSLENATDGMQPMALDPSKGAILSLMVQTPNFAERIKQGGGIGYLILAIGAVGLLIVLQRGVALFLTRRAVSAQAKSNESNDRNPLGRLQHVVTSDEGGNTDTLALRLDEQMAEESARLNRGLPMVAVFAAVSPLLGLLGTVTGMIETFQSITLFGTGDPKLMSGGISQALVTTQLGLAVAIPLVLLHSFLAGRANRLVEELGKRVADLLATK